MGDGRDSASSSGASGSLPSTRSGRNVSNSQPSVGKVNRPRGIAPYDVRLIVMSSGRTQSTYSQFILVLPTQ